LHEPAPRQAGSPHHSRRHHDICIGDVVVNAGPAYKRDAKRLLERAGWDWRLVRGQWGSWILPAATVASVDEVMKALAGVGAVERKAQKVEAFAPGIWNNPQGVIAPPNYDETLGEVVNSLKGRARKIMLGLLAIEDHAGIRAIKSLWPAFSKGRLSAGEEAVFQRLESVTRHILEELPDDPELKFGRRGDYVVVVHNAHEMEKFLKHFTLDPCCGSPLQDHPHQAWGTQAPDPGCPSGPPHEREAGGARRVDGQVAGRAVPGGIFRSQLGCG